MPKDSSPTWELEMLVSGAVLFSLFQLPHFVDDALARWEPHATFEAGFALLMLYAYAKGALYILIAAFVMHLGVRAYWVGLIGLNSVFSRGVQWENTQLGPIAQEVYRERMPTLPRMISRLDNFASVIFSFAFLVVIVTVASVPLMAVFAGLGYLVSKLLFGGRYFDWVAGTLLLAFALPPMIVALVDRRYGARFTPESRPRRVLRRLTGAFYHTQMVGILGPVLFTLTSNGRRKTTYVLFYIVLIGGLYAALGEWVMRRGLFTANGADYFSTASNDNSLDYAFYEAQWPDAMVNSTAPSIQSDVIRDPYVRLFIPYQPSRHNPAMASRCSGVAPLARRGVLLVRPGRSDPVSDSAAARALGCLAAIHAVKLNGAPVAGLRFRFASHPRTGVDGIVAYLPTASLPRGENVITVMPPPRRPGSTNKRPVEAWVIPFWL
jgi:hypothetical protein